MKSFLWTLLVAGFSVLIGFLSGADTGMLFDAEAIVVEIGVTILVLSFAGLLKDFFKSFSIVESKKTFLLCELRRSYEAIKLSMISLCATGMVVFLISFIAIMRDITNLQAIGKNLAVALLVLLYAVMLVLILLPLLFKLKIKINEYMSRED